MSYQGNFFKFCIYKFIIFKKYNKNSSNKIDNNRKNNILENQKDFRLGIKINNVIGYEKKYKTYNYSFFI